jgi:type III secretion protein V
MSSPASSLNSFIGNAKSGNISAMLTKNADILFPIIVLLMLVFLLFPIPHYILSALVVINIAISAIILVTSLYISSPAQLTSYPTILLLTTIFRLSLSVAATTNILNKGYAGSVIEQLGHITAGGVVLVGAVKFIVILVVQFLVVAKGAERVSEVAARFTLDAMPGKQMAIDADLRSGLITQEESRTQRNELQKESQLHGAMDGAMKFVKGDSIATIIISLVNIVAGIITGMAKNPGATLGEIGEKYTILTFGDGLAAIISSLLITVSAAIVVTRVAASDEKSSIGADIQLQLLSNPRPLMIIGGLFLPLSLALWSPFFGVVGLIVGGYGIFLHNKKKLSGEKANDPSALGNYSSNEEDDLQPSFTVPLTIVVSSQLTHLIDANTPSGKLFQQELPKLRSALYYDLGVLLPQCHVSGDAPLKENQYFIALKEVPVGIGFIKPNHVYVNDSADNIKVFGLEGENVLNPADLRPGSWIPVEQRPIAETAGLKVWEAREVITLHLSRVLRKHAFEFVGIQEAQGYLDFASRGVPKLVESVIPGVVTIYQFTDVLQRLVQEGISIRDIKTILDALAEWGRIEKDTVMLTEYVRSSLKRYISFRYTAGKDTLFVYLLDPEIEDVIRGSIRRTSTGSFLSLDPAITHDILDAIRREIANLPPSAQQPVVVTDMELRRFVRKMVELEFPSLAVLSYQELTSELNVQPLGRISMSPTMPQSSFSEFNEIETEQNEFAEMLTD